MRTSGHTQVHDEIRTRHSRLQGRQIRTGADTAADMAVETAAAEM